MRAGTLDRRITIERVTTTRNATGGLVETWAPLVFLRAQVVSLSTGEFVRTYGEAPEGLAIFRTRYLAGLTTADRIVYAGHTFELKEVKEVGRRKGLELRAVARNAP